MKKNLVNIFLSVVVLLIGAFFIPEQAEAACILGLGSTCSAAQNAAVQEGRDPSGATPAPTGGCANGMYLQPDGSCSIFLNGPPTQPTPTYTPINSTTDGNLAYTLLEPFYDTHNLEVSKNFAAYVASSMTIIVSIVAFLAAIRLIVSGWILFSSSVTNKRSSAKDGIKSAVFALVLSLSVVLILKTINPRLVQLPLNLNPTTGLPTASSVINAIPSQPNAAQATAASCPSGSIATCSQSSTPGGCSTICTSLTQPPI